MTEISMGASAPVPDDLYNQKDGIYTLADGEPSYSADEES